MIYQTLDFNDFQNAFDRYGRSAQFSYTGLKMLYEYLWDLSDGMGQDIELDVIGLCCQYSEYDKASFLRDYSLDGVDSIEDLEQSLIDGDLERVIAYDIDNNIILVNDDY